MPALDQGKAYVSEAIGTLLTLAREMVKMVDSPA